MSGRRRVFVSSCLQCILPPTPIVAPMARHTCAAASRCINGGLRGGVGDVARAVVSSLICLLLTASAWAAEPTRPPALRAELGRDRPGISFLSWDTEGGDRLKRNLLRNDVCGFAYRFEHGPWTEARTLAGPANVVGGSTQYVHVVAPDIRYTWTIDVKSDSMTFALAAAGAGLARVKGLEWVMPFNARVTPTTVLPADWAADGTLRLPAIISAPDFGQMLVSEGSKGQGRPLGGRLEGDRGTGNVDFAIELPSLADGETLTLRFEPTFMPPPAGMKDDLHLWRLARRGWLNALQCSARWGDQSRPFSAPAGTLANNVVSDPASCSLWFYADQTFWTPSFAPGVSGERLVRRTIDWWLDHKIRPTGEMICYWDYGNFLDANAGPLIAAWDYVETSGDREWLGKRIEQLESLAEFLARRDVDGDGLIEATQSGNLGTLVQPNRSCGWFDALNMGNKDGLTNAIIYRAFRCLADLEAKQGRSKQQARYTTLADHLKAGYVKALYNPATGWLGWWRSADGELHDYASPVVNGIAIEYGLVEPEQGREILKRLRAKMKQVGYTRLDLGVPPMLIPVRRGDYLLPDAPGLPKRDDGADTLGEYMNGGVTAGQVLHFLAAHYVVGDPQPADEILRAMLNRQQRGEFQNGVRDVAHTGIDWTTWDGKPSGYEGYLADSYRFLQAVLLREASFRDKLYRPLRTPAAR